MSGEQEIGFKLPQLENANERAYADIPKGMLVTVETSLERFVSPTPSNYPLLRGYKLVKTDPEDIVGYRKLYHAIGDPWLWYGRLSQGDDAIQNILLGPDTTALTLIDPDGDRVGIFEAQRQGEDTLEVSYFGLVPEATRSGLGRSMMENGLAAAWTPSIRRTWLHTCTFDSPQALTFYQRLGFKAFKQRVELALDPRLSGALPRSAAPHIPLADLSKV